MSKQCLSILVSIPDMMGSANRTMTAPGPPGFGDTHPARKPDPDHLLNLLHPMGARAEAAVMGGDHHNDVFAARGVGTPCIFAAWGYE